MSNVSDAVDGLVEAILERDEYNRYQGILQKLKRYPELKEKVDEFRLRNFELQNSDMDRYRLMEETDRSEKEYAKLRSDPMVNRFLSEELAFCKMMQGVFGEIMQAIDFE